MSPKLAKQLTVETPTIHEMNEKRTMKKTRFLNGSSFLYFRFVITESVIGRGKICLKFHYLWTKPLYMKDLIDFRNRKGCGKVSRNILFIVHQTFLFLASE